MVRVGFSETIGPTQLVIGASFWAELAISQLTFGRLGEGNGSEFMIVTDSTQKATRRQTTAAAKGIAICNSYRVW
jgi:hypothetical protein